MTPTRTAARERRSTRFRLPRLAVLGLACTLSAGTGAVAFGAAGADAVAAGGWTATQAPLPGTAATDPSVSVRQVTCAAVSSCVGVAIFTNAARNRAGVIEQLNGHSWQAIAAPVPSGTLASAQVVLTSVSCPSAGSCGISGYLDTASSRQPEVLTLLHGKGTAEAAPLLPATEPESSTSLSSISCPRPGRCVAVGRYQDDDAHYQGLIEVQAGTTWHAVKAPLPADAGPDPVGGLEWVTCQVAGHAPPSGPTSTIRARGSYLLTYCPAARGGHPRAAPG